MPFPRFSIRTLMIAVAVMGLLLAAVIMLRRAAAPAVIAVTVINKTQEDINVACITCRNSNTSGFWDSFLSWENVSVRPGELATIHLETYGCDVRQTSLEVLCESGPGRQATGIAEVPIDGGSLSHVRCRVGRDADGVTVAVCPEGRPIDMIAPADYAMTLLGLAVLLTPILLIACVIAWVIGGLKADLVYAERLRRYRDCPAVCPWPPALSHGPGLR